ncbi:hypothetical protein A2U01_0114976, partial [Trifolium medium]|nr:hypothetical protein [Trifolium medium]
LWGSRIPGGCSYRSGVAVVFRACLAVRV